MSLRNSYNSKNKINKSIPHSNIGVDKGIREPLWTHDRIRIMYMILYPYNGDRSSQVHLM